MSSQQSTPQWAAFAESLLANHMHGVCEALATTGLLCRRLMPERFVSWHRERTSIRLPCSRRTLHLVSMATAHPHQDGHIEGNLEYRLEWPGTQHIRSASRYDAVRWCSAGLNTDEAQARLARVLEESFLPERVAEVIQELLVP